MLDLLRYSPPAGLLKDKVVLITGAGGGIGGAVAQACAQAGAAVVLLGRTVSKLEKTYDAIVAAGGPEPALYPLNLEGATYKDYEELAATIEREFGRLDGLVHCAALFDHLKPLAEHEPGLWLRCVQVNLTAPFLLTQVCLPLLRTAPEASVVFVNDLGTCTPRPYWGAYGVAKAGLEHLMNLLARELSTTQVRVNSLDPGPVKTELRARAFPAEASTAARLPAAVAPAFLYLLGGDSHAIHGQALSLPAISDR